MSADVYRHDNAGVIVTRLSAGTGRGVVYQITLCPPGSDAVYVTLSAAAFQRFAYAMQLERTDLIAGLFGMTSASGAK